MNDDGAILDQIAAESPRLYRRYRTLMLGKTAGRDERRELQQLRALLNRCEHLRTVLNRLEEGHRAIIARHADVFGAPEEPRHHARDR